MKAGYQEYSRPCAIQVQTTNTLPSRASILTKSLIAQSTSLPLRNRSSLVARQKPTIGWNHHRYFLCPDSSLIRRSSQFLISVSSRDISRTRDWPPAFLSSGDRLDGEAHSQFARLNVKIRGPDCISRLTKEERHVFNLKWRISGCHRSITDFKSRRRGRPDSDDWSAPQEELTQSLERWSKIRQIPSLHPSGVHTALLPSVSACQTVRRQYRLLFEAVYDDHWLLAN